MNICARAGLIFPPRPQTPSEAGPCLTHLTNAPRGSPGSFPAVRKPVERAGCSPSTQTVSQQTERSGLNPTRPEGPVKCHLVPKVLPDICTGKWTLPGFPNKGTNAVLQIFPVFPLDTRSGCISPAPLKFKVVV